MLGLRVKQRETKPSMSRDCRCRGSCCQLGIQYSILTIIHTRPSLLQYCLPVLLSLVPPPPGSTHGGLSLPCHVIYIATYIYIIVIIIKTPRPACNLCKPAGTTDMNMREYVRIRFLQIESLNVDGLVIRGCNDPFAVWRKSDRSDLVGVYIKSRHLLPRS